MNYVTIPGAKASGDMSTSQFLVVSLTGSATVNFEVQETTATTQIPVGILQNDPSSSGAAAEVAISGICKVRYGGSVTQGALLTFNASALATASSTADEQYIIGTALENGTSTGIYYALIHAPYLYTT
jgi:hypothetical protein